MEMILCPTNLHVIPIVSTVMQGAGRVYRVLALSGQIIVTRETYIVTHHSFQVKGPNLQSASLISNSMGLVALHYGWTKFMLGWPR